MSLYLNRTLFFTMFLASIFITCDSQASKLSLEEKEAYNKKHLFVRVSKEVVELIMRKLPVEDWPAFALTCKHFAKILSDEKRQHRLLQANYDRNVSCGLMDVFGADLGEPLQKIFRGRCYKDYGKGLSLLLSKERRVYQKDVTERLFLKTPHLGASSADDVIDLVTHCLVIFDDEEASEFQRKILTTTLGMLPLEELQNISKCTIPFWGLDQRIYFMNMILTALADCPSDKREPVSALVFITMDQYDVDDGQILDLFSQCLSNVAEGNSNKMEGIEVLGEEDDPMDVEQ